MKDNQFNAPNQAYDCKSNEPITMGVGVSASAPLTPPSGGGGSGTNTLLYLSCSNSDNEVNRKKENKAKKPLKKGQRGWKGDDWTPNNKDYKIVKSLRENIKHWGKIYGSEKLFFLTLTFKENLTDPKEAQRRFNNFNRQFNRLSKVQWLYKGIEPQERGSLHYHIIGYHQNDLGAETLDWDSYKKSGEARAKKNWGLMYKYQRKFSATANDELKEMWDKVRSIAKGSKFGRSEFLPVRSANCIGNYVGKYLGKCFASQNNGTWIKGLKRFSYSNKAPQVHGRQFSWVKGTTELTWRQKVANWAHGVGVKDADDMIKKYGKKWALDQRENINYFGMVWSNREGKTYGHARPAMYPSGVMGNILGNMGKVQIPEDWENIEGDLWEKFHSTQTNRRGLKHHAEHFRKYARAKKHAEFNAKVYG